MALIITFSVSLVLLVAILVYQTRQIKLGKVSAVIDDSPFDLPMLRNKVLTWLSDFSRHLVVTTLRIYIKITYFLKERKEASSRHLLEVRHKIAKFVERKKKSGPVSEFLETVGEYKAKIKEIKKEIEQEEK